MHHINQKLQLKPSLLLFKDMKSFSYAAVVLVGTSTFSSISASQSSSSPTSPTPNRSTSCTGNTPNWQDSYGDGCEWYESEDKPGCPNYGDSYEGDMGVANDNCCYCFGTGVSTSTTTGAVPSCFCVYHIVWYWSPFSQSTFWPSDFHSLRLILNQPTLPSLHFQPILLQFQNLQFHLRALAARLIGRIRMEMAASGTNLRTSQDVLTMEIATKVTWA